MLEKFVKQIEVWGCMKDKKCWHFRNAHINVDLNTSQQKCCWPLSIIFTTYNDRYARGVITNSTYTLTWTMLPDFTGKHATVNIGTESNQFQSWQGEKPRTNGFLLKCPRPSLTIHPWPTTNRFVYCVSILDLLICRKVTNRGWYHNRHYDAFISFILMMLE